VQSVTIEQLLILAVLILFPLFNSVVSWLAERSKQLSPEAGVPEAQEKPAPRIIRTPPVPARQEPGPRVLVRPPPAALPARPGEAQRRKRAAPLRAPEPTSMRRGPDRWRIASHSEARRAIVLMTLLGPCRALEPPPGREASET
jgi:hypothetical protein